ncbi:hypothetical protein VCR15J2_390018 [Vibrio coralliirubri]|uniref:hypothetical protein n=1 Tax=Vibrio coralliirubri TaxID=1516159 RepID=UPI0006349D29|nr:hypothetical protein [Vibrio coralliirubri]CDT52753.1 hypothetical protein VCR15J2_390018 [Vibrio coralliirubri]
MSEDKTTEKPKQKRISAKDYRAICIMWRSGDYTVKELATQFDVNETSLRKRFARDGIKKGEDAELHNKAVAEVIQKDTVKQAEETRELILTTQKNHLAWLDGLSRRALLIAQQSAKDNVPLGSFKDDVQTLKGIADIVRGNYQTASQILRIDDISDLEEDLPTFTVNEMTADDVEEIRESQRQQLEEFTTGNVGEAPSEDDDEVLMEE